MAYWLLNGFGNAMKLMIIEKTLRRLVTRQMGCLAPQGRSCRSYL